MKLGRHSSNIEDRRGMGLPVVGGGIGTIVIALIVYFLGGDPGAVVQNAPQAQQQQEGAPVQPGQDPQADLVSQVLADTEDTWKAVAREQMGGEYQEPRLVLFSDAVASACGTGQSAMGPFYCPLDRKVYIDLGFFRELDQRFGAPGDFAQAYVVAHEVGHHVQTLTGISEKVHAARQRAGRAEGNELSVRQELQADCFAGLWAHHGQRQRKILEPGDVEEGLRAAAAIGDDRLQRQAQGRIVPESFTHGSSEQRVRWFRRGLESGRVADCDTFNTSAL